MDELIIMRDARPNRSDAIKNREQILKTASELIAVSGVDQVTMSAIADAAGVGKGTLYRHFPSKTDLLAALLDADQRNLQERTLAYLREHPGQPIDNLHWFLSEALAFVERNLRMLSGMEMVLPGSGAYHPAHGWWRQTIRGLLAQSGAYADADYAADILYMMLDPGVNYYLMIVRGYDFDRLRYGICQTCKQLLS
ncbi:MAG: TetR/AcrR family transcriptional regulator [Anaerolineae bacterium]|nr:TetR/AcrR family transcriptional regulator [Anaerolineae bacterium]